MSRISRSLVLAVTLAAGISGYSPSATAADALPAAGLVDLLPVGEVTGDGGTAATMHVLALFPNGAPMLGLKLKAEAAGAEVSEVVEVGKGLYSFTVTPGGVAAARELKVTVRGKTAEKVAIEASRDVRVVPSGAGRIAVTANPPAVVLGVDTSVSVSFQIPDVGAGLPGVDDLVVRASAGTVSDLVSLGGGRYSARFLPPRVNFPHLAMLTIADRRQPDVLRGSVVVPLQGKVDYPVVSKPSSSVILRVAGREYGPVPTSADGRALVPIIVPPGLQKATMITVADGSTTESELDLGVPEGRRLSLFPVPTGLPADSSLTIPIRLLAVKGDGTPDPEAALDLSVTAGRIGRPIHLGEGVYEAPYTPPDGRVQMAATIQATLPGGTVQTDAIELVLLPATGAKLTLSTEPTSLAAAGTGLKVFARLTAADGTGLATRSVRMDAAGATLKGNVNDLAGGDYRGEFTAANGSDVVVEVTAPAAVSSNALAHVVLLPSSEHLPPDGVTSSSLTVVTTDAWGYAVPNVDVTLALREGGGALPSSVKTDAFGLARVFYTAGDAPGLVVIEASAGGHWGAAGLVLSGLDVVPDLPVSGTASDVRVATAWEQLRAVVVVPREGGTGTPVAAQPDRSAVGTLAALAVTTEPASVAPGGTVSVKIRALDATGRGVPGARLDLLASGGARFGVVNDLGGGDYQATLTVPADVTERVRVSVLDPAGATSAILEVPVAAADAVAADPWAQGATPGWGTPATDAAAATTTPDAAKPPRAVREPRPQTERPLFRGRLSGLISSYAYGQEPAEASGALLDNTLAWGGDAGGAALPVGFEFNARGYVPGVKALGFLGSFRFSRYSVESDAFVDPARDNLLAAHVDVLGRVPIPIGDAELSIGARAGFRFDDFVTFRGCTEPGCVVDYTPLRVPGLGAGLEVSAEFWHMYAIASAHAGFAYATQPYAVNVDVNLGWNIVKNFFLDAGFGWQRRNAELQGRDSGQVRGTIRDAQVLGTLGVGVSF